ncbi:DUF3999 domain-containing protein [Pseudomonas sp. UL073]|uniref:DUF3999 domain-containing protein n=1 Tax=Zestomonas insulae TaxID=2809017 RepID=A0ABS2IDB3_9GAMM|nr:DUF3999 domain-containing protein [Pseudomonas insulae]MBM7061096.1 DUF3999 domain-containing protein [Pseudomonas insulae]
MKLLVQLAACSVALASALALAAPAEFASQVPLTVSGAGPWYRLELPIEAQLAARHGDLRDLRIFNAEGEALAYSLRSGAARDAETRAEQAVRVFPLRGQAGGALPDSLKVVRSSTGTIVEIPSAGGSEGGREIVLGWLLDASAADFAVQRLTLDWSAAGDGFQRFRIEASDDLSSWRLLGEGQLARLSFNGEQIDKNDVELPATQVRYLRLLWIAPQEAATLRGARLSGSRSSREPAPLVWSAPQPGHADATGVFTWQLPLELPLARVRLGLPQANTLAPVALQGRRDGQTQWSPLARGVLYRLALDGGEMRHEDLELLERPVRQLRLQVDARGGGLGAAAPMLSVALRATEVVFLARGSAPYRLALGSAAAQDASLPLATLVPGFDDQRLAAMGSARLNGTLQAGEVAAAVAPSGLDWKRAGLWAVLLVGVGLLAAMAINLLRAGKAQS